MPLSIEDAGKALGRLRGRADGLRDGLGKLHRQRGLQTHDWRFYALALCATSHLDAVGRMRIRQVIKALVYVLNGG